MSQCRIDLNVIEIADPCRVPWRTMSGGDKVRFCTQCSKSVYNLSAMTTSEAEELLSTMESPCVRFYRRADRTVVTADRCGGRPERMWRRLTLPFAAMFTLIFGAGCDQGKLTTPPSSKTTQTNSTKLSPSSEQPGK